MATVWGARISGAAPPEEDAIAKLAGANKLDVFGPFKEIDYLARLYPAYTHDDVFYLEFNFAMTLIWFNMEREAYNQRHTKIKRQTQQKTKRK